MTLFFNSEDLRAFNSGFYFSYYSHRIACEMQNTQKKSFQLILIGISPQKKLLKFLCVKLLLMFFHSLVKINLLNLNVPLLFFYLSVELQFFNFSSEMKFISCRCRWWCCVALLLVYHKMADWWSFELEEKPQLNDPFPHDWYH